MNMNLPLVLPAFSSPMAIPKAGMGQAMGLLTESTGWIILDAALGGGVGWLLAPKGQETGYILGGALATGLAGVFGLAGLVGYRVLFGHEEGDEPRVKHDASDYVAVNNRGRTIAGPFKHYDQAKREADAAGGYVKFTAEDKRLERHYVDGKFQGYRDTKTGALYRPYYYRGRRWGWFNPHKDGPVVLRRLPQ